MVESDLKKGKYAHEEGFGYQRDPSFSGWCDDDGIYHPNSQQEGVIVNASEEDLNFELPVLQEVRLSNEHLEGDEDQHSRSQLSSLKMSNSSNMDMVSSPSPRRGNKTDKYASFDIENVSGRELEYPDINYVDKHKVVPSSSNYHIAIADVLKTSFFILAWYTFSTFLTLYNKTLLGDDMGRFPAPLLMNTVHFAMQAVLSKGITYFWSQEFQLCVPMSWKDYLMRDGLCLSQLYQRLLEQRWIST